MKLNRLIFVICVFGLQSCNFFGSSGSYYDAGVAEMSKGNFDGAIKKFLKGTANNPKDVNCLFGLGWANQLKGNLPDAAQFYRAAINTSNETMVRTYYNYGVLLQGWKRLPEATEAYKAAIALSPNVFNANFNLGFVYLDAGNLALAKQQFVRAAEIDPTNPKAHMNAGILAEKVGKKDEAIRHYEAALKLEPGNALVQKNLQALRGR